MSISTLALNLRQRRTSRRRCFYVCILVLASIALTACTAVPKVPNSGNEENSARKVLARQFSLNGRISVRVGDKIDSGQIRWQRSQSGEQIGLYSPLGSQVAELVSDKLTGVATLRRGAETVKAASVAELTLSMLGVAIDLDLLAGWVQGHDLTENESRDFEFANGDRWQVTAERYQRAGTHQFASRVIATSKDTVVRLIIDEWVPE